MKYVRKSIERVNKLEAKSEGQKQTYNSIMIKVSGIIHKRENQREIRIA